MCYGTLTPVIATWRFLCTTSDAYVCVVVTIIYVRYIPGKTTSYDNVSCLRDQIIATGALNEPVGQAARLRVRILHKEQRTLKPEKTLVRLIFFFRHSKFWYPTGTPYITNKGSFISVSCQNITSYSFKMDKVEQIVKKADEYLAKYPSVTQFGTFHGKGSSPFTITVKSMYQSYVESLYGKSVPKRLSEGG